MGVSLNGCVSSAHCLWSANHNRQFTLVCAVAEWQGEKKEIRKMTYISFVSSHNQRFFDACMVHVHCVYLN